MSGGREGEGMGEEREQRRRELMEKRKKKEETSRAYCVSGEACDRVL